jgi:hypothetical protein
MNTKRIELDVDIIGGLGSLTKEEEVALSIFFKKRKINSKAIASKPKSKTTKRSKLQLK